MNSPFSFHFVEGAALLVFSRENREFSLASAMD